MPTAWPNGLPDYMQKDGMSGDLADNTLWSRMDVGPAKLRRRSTAAPDVYAGSMWLTATQAATFETFYKTTLAHGSLPFTWKHPRTRASADMRFVGAPKLAPDSGVGNRWRLAMSLEVLP